MLCLWRSLLTAHASGRSAGSRLFCGTTLRGCPKWIEYLNQVLPSAGTDAGRLALSRSSHIEHMDVVLRQPRTHDLDRGRLFQIDYEQRPLVLASHLTGKQGAACGDAKAEYQRAVGLQHILHGPRRVVCRGVLLEAILARNFTVLGAAALWAPSAVGDTQSYGGVEPRTIDPCLPAADDPFELHAADCIDCARLPASQCEDEPRAGCRSTTNAAWKAART